MVSICNQPCFDDHETIMRLRNPYTGLEGVVSIHDSSCGPAAGGTRLRVYDTEAAMCADVNLLSRAMTYKNLIHGLPHGGGKAVFNRHPTIGMTTAELRWYAAWLNKLGGTFSTGEDIGFTVKYVNYLSQFTPYVTGKSKALGGGGDPSLRTVEGLIHGMHACLAFIDTYSDTFDALADYRVFVQGAGKVGLPLIKNLLERGAHVLFCDVNEKQAAKVHKKFPATELVSPEHIFDHTFDFFAPCGIGGTVNADTIPLLKCRFVVGSANNVLRNPAQDALMLKERDILLAPDYAVNGGGMINIASEMRKGGYDSEWARAKTANIFDLILRILQTADASGLTTVAVADNIAEEQLRQARQKRNMLFETTIAAEA